ncbi:ParA family protein [Rothia nasimurium]|uniref:ParA family protein n=1 Tax=Rothia nasimurium TaxID=85336 RepID=UPI003B9DF4F4
MGQVVSVSSLKGGVGKTSVILGFASAAQAAGLRTLVLDLDPHGDASTGLGASPAAPEIGELLLSPTSMSLEDAAAPASWSALGSLGNASVTGLDAGTWVVRGSARSLAFESLPYAQALGVLPSLVGPVRPLFDLVLVDCPPTLGRLTETAWAASDQVVSVAEPSLFSVAGTERTLRALARFEANTSYSVGAASVLINKVRATDPEHMYRAEEMRVLFGDLVAATTIPESPVIQRLQGAAYPVHYWPEAAAQPLASAFTLLLSGLMSSAS